MCELFPAKNGLVEFWTPVEGDLELGGGLVASSGHLAARRHIAPCSRKAVFERDQTGTNDRTRAHLVAKRRVEVTAIVYRFW